MASCRRHWTSFSNRCCASTAQQLCWLAVLSSACLFVYYQLFLHFTYNHLQDEYFNGAAKCPACFGTSLCYRFRHNEFRFHSYSSIRLLDFVNLKNVYYATYLNHRPVVLKKLGHNSELTQFDSDLCTHIEEDKGCDVSRHIYKSKLSDIMYSEVLEEKDVMGLSDLVRCPSRRLLDRIWDSFMEREDDGTMARDHKLMLATTIAFNPEPIILQAFPNRQGWPFPVYMGACGRFVVEEYAGRTLSFFYDMKFSTRAALAVQRRSHCQSGLATKICHIPYIFHRDEARLHLALKIAEYLTENREEFALYMTDVSEDNFAVMADGSMVVIDAENIIVVDKMKIKEDRKPGWDTKHQSEHMGCGSKRECLFFSHTDLCNHYYSDHNYYAVCQGLFGENSKHGDGGLLHSIPADLSPTMTAKVKGFISECRNPRTEGGRYVAVKSLKALLLKLV